MMISPIEKLDFIFGKARDEFEMKILISSPIVKTTLFSLLLTRNINWKLISPKGGCVLGQEQGKEKNLTFDKVGCLTVTVGFVFLFNTHTCFQLPILAADIIITLLFGPDNFTRKRTTRTCCVTNCGTLTTQKNWRQQNIPDPKCLPSMFRSLGSPLAF